MVDIADFLVSVDRNGLDQFFYIACSRRVVSPELLVFFQDQLRQFL